MSASESRASTSAAFGPASTSTPVIRSEAAAQLSGRFLVSDGNVRGQELADLPDQQLEVVPGR